MKLPVLILVAVSLVGACSGAASPTASAPVATITASPTPPAMPTNEASPAAAPTIDAASPGATEPASPTLNPASPAASDAATPAAEPAANAEARIEIIDFAFDPATLQVAVGTTVEWTNSDPYGHTATSGDPDQPAGTFDSGILDEGETFAFRFDQPGTYAYFCDLHPRMTGSIEVTG